MKNNFSKYGIRYLSRFLYWVVALLVIFVITLKFIAPYAIQKYAEHHGIIIQKILLSMTEAHLEEVHFPEGEIKRIRIEYSPAHIMDHQIDRLLVEGLDLKINAQSYLNSTNMQFFSIPFTIKDVHIKDFKGQITGLSYDTYHLDPIHFNGNASGSLEHDQNLQGDLQVTFLPHPNFEGGLLSLKTEPNRLSTTFSIDKFTYPLTKAALDLTLKGQMERGALFSFEGKVQEKDLTLLAFSGNTNFEDQWDISTTTENLVIDPTSASLEHYWINVPSELKTFGGKITFTSQISWHQNQLKQKYDLALREGVILYDKIIASGIHTNLSLTQLYPLTGVPAVIKISEIITPFGNLKNLTMGLNLREGSIKISNLKTQFVKGNLSLNHFTVYPLPKEQKATLRLHHLSLDELSSNLKSSGLSATGTISGTLPVKFFGDLTFALEKSSLYTDSKGILSYEWLAAEQSQDHYLNLTAQALKDFRYKSIHIDLKKERRKDINAIVILKGYNPHVLSGREFDIKVDLSGDIMQTIIATWDIYQGEKGLWQKKSLAH